MGARVRTTVVMLAPSRITYSKLRAVTPQTQLREKSFQQERTGNHMAQRSRTARSTNRSKLLQRRTRRLIICSATPAPPARRRSSCAPRLGWQPQQLAPLGCKVHGGAALVTTAPTLREHRRARMHDVQHAPALRPMSAVSSACNGAARGPRALHARRGGDHALHARRGGDHAPRAFTQAHDGGCSGGARVQAPRRELLRTALGRRRGQGT